MPPDSGATGLAAESDEPKPGIPTHEAGSARQFFPWALSLFLLGIGMKLLMLEQSINPLPWYDQWEAEGAAIYLPYANHALHFADLFRPQNEHRIFFTHIYDLALLWLNGQWDSQLQMVLNAVIHSATLAGFAWVLAFRLGRRFWPFIWAPLAVAVISPFGWENAMWGFQSQFYFLALFSLLSICLLSCRPMSVAWFCGLAAGVCATFSMASGLLPFVAAGVMLVLELWRSRLAYPRHFVALGWCVALAFAGLLAMSKEGADNVYAAHSLSDFCQSLGKNLAWPCSPKLWLAPLNLCPLFLLGWAYFRAPQPGPTGERILLTMGIWTILQCVATAIMRGSNGPPPPWRYMDTLCFLFTANFLGAALVLIKYRSTLPFPSLWCAILGVWLVTCAVGLWTMNSRAWSVAIPNWAHFQQIRVELTRKFLATDDPAVFANRIPHEVPWIHTPGLVSLLREKAIREILPACARDPLKVAPENSTAPQAFFTNGIPASLSNPTWESCLGCFGTNEVPLRGTFVSAPLTSSLPYVQIEIAGNLESPDSSLRLEGLTSGAVSQVKPAHEPGNHWSTVDVKVPGHEFKLVARNDSGTNWFAFRQLREMGRLSYWAERIVPTGSYFLWAGAACLALAAGLYWFKPVRASAR